MDHTHDHDQGFDPAPAEPAYDPTTDASAGDAIDPVPTVQQSGGFPSPASVADEGAHFHSPPSEPMYDSAAPRPYRPATGLVTVLTILFGLYGLLAMFGAFSEHMQVQLLERVAAGEPVSDDELLMNDARVGLLGLGTLGVYVTLVVLFCIWIYRANCNARALGAQRMNFSPGWCVGWFFVPVMWLFKPYQAVREIHRASDPEAGPLDWESRPTGSVVPLWWTVWLIAGFVGYAAARMSINAENAEAMITASWVMVGADVIDIPLALLAAAVVRGIHERQQLKHRMMMQATPYEEPTYLTTMAA